jgi:hypothetical protein
MAKKIKKMTPQNLYKPKMVHIAPKVYFVVRIGTVQEHVLFQSVAFTIFIKSSQDLSHTLGSVATCCCQECATRGNLLVGPHGSSCICDGVLTSEVEFFGSLVRLSRSTKCHFYEVKRHVLSQSRDHYGCVGGQNIQQS